jgi:hypothetical protein
MPTLERVWYESLTCERVMASPVEGYDEPGRSAGKIIMNSLRHEPLPHITAKLNYLKPMTDKPVAYTYEPPPGVPWRTGENAPHAVEIRNARPVAAMLSLDRQGYVVANPASEVLDFYDEAAIRGTYYPEVERLVRAMTGAVRVLIFDHNLRNGTKAAAGVKGIREPVNRVHNDFTERSGIARARQELLARGIDPTEIEGRRFALINVWRPISGPVRKDPLALCDASTIASSDFIASDLIFPHRVGETYSVTFNPSHRWYYFPDMTPDETLLIKCFDSAGDGRARFTAHTAFDDPSSPTDAAQRESIEVRTLAIFGDGAAGG